MVAFKVMLRFVAFSGVSAALMRSPIQGLEKRCTWDDGVGPIDCDTFSVIFGDGSFGGGAGTVKIRGPAFVVSDILNCDGDQWKTFFSPLPYTVDIHGGNQCKDSFPPDYWDNIWINYAAEHVDVASDHRCSSVYELDRGRRCLIRI